MSQKPLVIKVGGALLNDSVALNALLKVLASLQSFAQVILVHGGGDTVQSLLEKLQFESHKIDGVRVTPQEQIPYVAGALAGTVNTQLCAAAKTHELKPVGLTLLDGDMTNAEQVSDAFGAVGAVTPKSHELLTGLCAADFLPVISSIGCDDAGQILNVNADDAAAVIAQLMQADLILLSDVPGVLDGDKQLIPELNAHQIEQYCQQNVIQGGMVVKVKSALATAKNTQKSVFITSWKSPQSLMAFTSGESCGTRIYSVDSDKNTLSANSVNKSKPVE